MKSNFVMKAGFFLLFCHCHAIAAPKFYCPGELSTEPLEEIRSLKELPDEINNRIRKAWRYDAPEPERESRDPFRAMLNDSFPITSPEQEIADRDEKVPPRDIQKIPGRRFSVAGMNGICAIVAIQNSAPDHLFEIYVFEQNYVRWQLRRDIAIEGDPPQTLKKLFEYLKDH